MEKCPFCHVSSANGFDIIWEDENFIAFNDWKPASEHHIQLITRKHISGVRSLKKQDAELVRSMQTIGERLLDERGAPPHGRVMGFHIPPFNSVNHLHLHVQGLPYKPMRAFKYPISRGFGPFQIKGFGWFIEVEQATRCLDRGRSIGVFPC